MKILERNVYLGPSLYAHLSVTKVLLDRAPLEAWPTGKLGAEFADTLVAALPGLQQHDCSDREAGDFIRRMRGHAMEHVAIAQQNIAGEDLTFGKTRSVDGRPGVCTVDDEYAQRDEGIEAGEQALQRLRSLLSPEAPDTALEAARPDEAPAAGFVRDERGPRFAAEQAV